MWCKLFLVYQWNILKLWKLNLFHNFYFSLIPSQGTTTCCTLGHFTSCHLYAGIQNEGMLYHVEEWYVFIWAAGHEVNIIVSAASQHSKLYWQFLFWAGNIQVCISWHLKKLFQFFFCLPSIWFCPLEMQYDTIPCSLILFQGKMAEPTFISHDLW
jgi:hypothetical protein